MAMDVIEKNVICFSCWDETWADLQALLAGDLACIVSRMKKEIAMLTLMLTITGTHWHYRAPCDPTDSITVFALCLAEQFKMGNIQLLYE